MRNIEKQAIKKAMAILDAIKADYCIVFEGNEWGNLEPVREQQKKQSLEVAKYYKPYVENLSPGECREIPVPEEAIAKGIDAVKLRSVLSGYFNYKFGKGTCLTSVNKEAQTVEVLRVS